MVPIPNTPSLQPLSQNNNKTKSCNNWS